MNAKPNSEVLPTCPQQLIIFILYIFNLSFLRLGADSVEKAPSIAFLISNTLVTL